MVASYFLMGHIGFTYQNSWPPLTIRQYGFHLFLQEFLQTKSNWSYTDHDTIKFDNGYIIGLSPALEGFIKSSDFRVPLILIIVQRLSYMIYDLDIRESANG